MMRITTQFMTGAIALGLAAGWTAPASAKWESLHVSPRADGDFCRAEHNVNPTMKESDNRPLRLPAGFSQDVEVYGHFIDDPLFVAKLFGTGTASRVKGVGGATNAYRRCGNIGSVIVHITIPPDAAAGSSELRIGRGGSDWNSKIDVEIHPMRLASVQWASESLQGSSTNNTTGVQRVGPMDALGGCVDNLGGTRSISGNTINLTFPRGRSEGPIMDCLRRPIFVEFNIDFGGGTGPIDGSGGGETPDFNAVPAYNLPNGLVGLGAVPNQRLMRSIKFTDAFLQGFTTGSRRLTLTSNSTRANDLVIQLNTQ